MPSLPRHKSREDGSSSASDTGRKGVVVSVVRWSILVLGAFYGGFYLGYQRGLEQTAQAFNRARQAQQDSPVVAPEKDCPSPPPKEECQCPTLPPQPPKQSQEKTNKPLFPRATESFVAAMTLVDRMDFAHKFDTGVPLFDNVEANQQVLVLHAPQTIPATASKSTIRELPVDEATQKCNYLSVILTEPYRL
jgi:hypothetical protein